MTITSHLTSAVASTAVAITTVTTWLAGILPPLAALAALGFTLFQWWHHPKAKEWRKRWGK